MALGVPILKHFRVNLKRPRAALARPFSRDHIMPFYEENEKIYQIMEYSVHCHQLLKLRPKYHISLFFVQFFFSLKKQPQNSRSILLDGSRSLGLFR